jgi:hypothetical protein
MGPFLAAGEVLAGSRKGRRDKSSNGEESPEAVQKNLIRNLITSQMNGSLRSNSLKVGFSLLVLLLGAQASVYEPAPVYTNYGRTWDAALRAARETGIDLTLSIGLKVSSLGPRMAST